MDDRRLAQLERDVGRLEERSEQVPVMAEQINGLRRDLTGFIDATNKRFDKQEADQAGLRRTIVGFAFAVAGSAVAVLLGLTQIVH